MNTLRDVATQLYNLSPEKRATVAHQLENVACVLRTNTPLPGEGAVDVNEEYWIYQRLVEISDLLK